VKPGPRDGDGLRELVWTYRDAASGRRGELRVPNEVGSWPQVWGAEPSDDVRVEGLGIQPSAARLVASGLHVQITALVADHVRARDRLLAPGESVRIDRAFELGTVRFELIEPLPSED
jgi:hypothetical protein